MRIQEAKRDQPINDFCELLIVGHYTHDTIVKSHKENFHRLGGAAAYASAIATGLDQNFRVLSKAGSDFLYNAQCLQLPPTICDAKTTHFVNHTSKQARQLHVRSMCEPIYPNDIHYHANVGMVCGVIGEILPETIITLRKHCDILIGDIQGFIRKITNHGRVVHIPLGETDYLDIVSLFDFIKISEEELPFLDLSYLRKKTTLLITRGERGCTIYEKNRSYHLTTQPLQGLDHTGAGDCFLAGFAIGFNNRLSIKEAAILGNKCGAIAIQEIGIPSLKLISQSLETHKIHFFSSSNPEIYDHSPEKIPLLMEDII